MDRTEHIRIKFCGLTRLEDAIASVRAGVDMLGFNFYPKSPRYITPEDCARLVERLEYEIDRVREHVQLVGVYVNARSHEVDAIMKQCDLDLAQLSGNETAEEMSQFGECAFKAIRSGGRLTLTQIGAAYLKRKAPPALLVDAAFPGLYGGSGLTADWKQAEKLARKAPILLAGGLSAANVGEATRIVQPWGVDVATGIEAAPGIKDHAKMADFVQAVRDS